MFDDPAFDGARKLASDIADYIRRMGPFEPHRLPEEDMEYTTMPKVMEKLKERFQDMEGQPGNKNKGKKHEAVLDVE